MSEHITLLEQVRLRRFSPVDRLTPLFEVLVGDDIIFDVGEDDGSFDIMFHEAATKYRIHVDVFIAIVADAKAHITAAK
jgi:hypothetical protein